MAARVSGFGTTIFSEINNLAREHGAVNLGQGAPDFDPHPEVLAAAQEALLGGFNQYAPGIGIQKTRDAIAAHAARFYGHQVDPATEVVVTAGATEAIFATILGLCDPGDEVIVFEPVYDSYVPNMTMAGVIPRYVSLRPPDWRFDPDELRATFSDRTRAIIVNTPHNPTGKLYSREELMLIASLCQQYNTIAITDEVYEHIVYDGARHIRLAMLDGMHDRTVTISSLGKTFTVTGWKIGWCIGHPALITGINRAHQFITFAVASPLQAAAASALMLPDSYFSGLTATYQARRDYMVGALREAGFEVLLPQGGYFIMADWRGVAPVAVRDDLEFARWLITEVGVACIPPSAFYREENKPLAKHLARFAVCKKDATLQAAVSRLERAARR
jgi:N-succinyldiaminopimelate aminotransferase